MIIKYTIKNLIIIEITEIIICLFLGIKSINNNYKIIILMNIITNILFSFITYIIFNFININFYIYLIIIETIIILTERKILQNYFDFNIEKILFWIK